MTLVRPVIMSQQVDLFNKITTLKTYKWLHTFNTSYIKIVLNVNIFWNVIKYQMEFFKALYRVYYYFSYIQTITKRS